MLRSLILASLALLPAAPAAASTKASTMHYLKAQLFEHQGNYAAALQEYQTAVALDPQSAYLMEQAVSLALESGQTAAALDLAKRLVKLEPKSHKARFLLGNVHWARGEAAPAQEAFEEALRLNPGFPEAMLALGNLLGAQSPEKAKAYFERYLEANPDNAAEAHYQIALLEQKQGNMAAAVARLKSSLALSPESLPARFSLAQVYEVMRDTDAALAQYLEILDRDPANVPLLNQIGEIYYIKGDLDEATTHFLRAKSAAPGNPQSCLWLGIVFEQKGDFNAAVKYLSDSSALKDEAPLNLRLSYYLTQAGRLKEAVAVLEEARKKWPANDDIAYFLALGYDDLKRPDKAVALLSEILKAKPDFRDARFQLGALYEKSGKMPEAEREFETLIRQRPADAAALNYLGYSLADRGLKLPEAERLIRRAVEQDPANGAYRDSLGWSFHKQGRPAEALGELKQAVSLMPEDATIWEHLGDVYSVLGDTASAWDAWKRSEADGSAEGGLAGKLAAAEAALSAEQLGERFMELARRLHGRVESYGGLCEISGSVLGKSFSFNGVLAFKAPQELSVDLLGPLFVPMFRMRLTGEDGFEMGAVKLAGISPEALRDCVHQTLRVVRDYLSGRLLEGEPAVFHKGWRTQWVVTPAGQFFFGDRRLEFKEFHSAGSLGTRLSLDEFQERGERRAPAYLRLEGKGFSLGFRLPNAAVNYAQPAPAKP